MDWNLREGWRNFLEGSLSGDEWFATVHFVFPISMSSAERRIRTWLGRIEQSLKDFGYISNRPSEGLSAIVVHSPSNTHAHLLVNAKGLAELDKTRWEQRWKEIMRHKGETPTCKINPAWEGTNGAASYISQYFNLDDGSEIWFRGLSPLTSAEQARK